MDLDIAGEEPLNATLGARIRDLRSRQRVSLRELARRLAVSAATVSQIEHGRTGLTVHRLNQIAEALDVPMVEVLSAAGLWETGGPWKVAHPDRNVAAARPGDVRTPAAGRKRPLSAAAESAGRTDGTDWRTFPPLALGPVLTAALEAFLESGYGGASVRDIAFRCGLSVPGIYHHHASKQDMLAELLEIYMDSLLWRTTAARDEGAGPVERFALIVECLALHHTYRRALAFVGLSEMRSLDHPNRERILRLRHRQQRIVDIEAEEAARLGLFGTADPRDASRAVVTMCTSIPHWYQAEGQATPEEIARRYVRFSLDLMRCAEVRP